MNPKQRHLIENEHAQKYLNSCPASLCEMLLKLADAIPSNCFDFQSADQNGVDGVSKFVGKKLPGDLTMKRLVPSKDWELPIAGIKAKLAAGVPVGVYLNPGNKPAHGWLVDEIRQNAAGDDEIVLISKPSELGNGEGKQTITMTVTAAAASNMKWSDPVFLESIAPSNGGNP